MNVRPLLRSILCAAVPAVPALAQDPPETPKPPADAALDLTELSLEQLMEVPVEVGDRQSESLADTAASVFVLNEPEIRRSGLRSIPEVLRLVPGLIIAQDVPGAYGFSSRLGEYEFSGMLVLIDGQRLYPTLLRREYFQAIDLPLSVVERIEVVRGPGGSRWGDKASQGVINIVTKKAAAATDVRASGLVGTEERLSGTVRFGDQLNADTSYYIYGKMSQRDGGHPNTSGDRWDNNNIGMRLDTRLGDGVDATIDGNYHDSFIGDSYEIDPGFSSLNMIKGGHLKGKVGFAHADGSHTELRLAADGYDQDIRDYRDNVPEEFLRYREELFEASAQHSWRIDGSNRLTIGLSVRSLTVENFLVFAEVGEEYNETRGDVFAAWDWAVGEHVKVTIGGNVGYQDGREGSGVDVQPDFRVAWTPRQDLTIWGALSANQEPDRKIEDSGLLVHRESSRLRALELGVRRRFDEVLMLQCDTFYYDIDDQLNGFTTDPGSGATLYVTEGQTTAFGGELIATVKPADHVRVVAWIAVTEANSRDIDPSQFTTIEDIVPGVRGGATIGFDPFPGVELDSNVLYTEQHADIPTWWRVDLRLGWRPDDATSIDLVGQNLTDPHHQEYYYLEEVERGVYLMVTHRF